MRAEWLMVLGIAIFSTLLLTAMFLAARRDRKIWAAKMEAIEKKYTAALCESGARRARSKMHARALKRMIDKILRSPPPDGFPGRGPGTTRT